MTKKKVLFYAIIAVILLLLAFLIINNFYIKKDSFSLKKTFIKSSIMKGAESSIDFEITNNENSKQRFEIYIKSVSDFISFEESEFAIEPKSSKTIKMTLKDVENVPKVYTGTIIVSNSLVKKTIPVVFMVEEDDKDFAIIHNEINKYSDVYPGGKFGLDIKVFDLQGLGISSVHAVFYIKNMDGEIIWDDEGDLIVNGGISKIINIPESWNYGDYVFITLIEHEGKKSVSSYLFAVSEKKDEVFSGNLKFFIWIILFFISGIVLLFFYFLHTRSDFFMELKRQQERELKKNLEIIENYKRKIKNLEDENERQKKIKRVVEVKKIIVRRIKERQKKQRKEFKKLKKKGKKSEMQRKLGQWKNEGFEFPEAEKELGKISEKSIKGQVGKWKKAGYKTDVLKR